MRLFKIATFSFVVTVLSAVAISSAQAQNLQQRRDQENGQKLADDSIQDANKRCKSSVKLENDWNGIDYSSENFQLLTSKCSIAVDSMRRLCSDDLGQQAVQTIKVFQCKYGQDELFSLSEGTFTVTMANDSDGSTVSTGVTEYLKKNL